MTTKLHVAHHDCRMAIDVTSTLANDRLGTQIVRTPSETIRVAEVA